MTTLLYEVVGVAPMWPRRPTFATPVFRTELSNAHWYQYVGKHGRIEGFGQIDENALNRCFWQNFAKAREVGQEAFFGYVVDATETFVGIKEELVPTLREEFFRYADRPFLRHSIAKFVDDANLVARAANEINSDKWTRRSGRLSCFISCASADLETADIIQNQLARTFRNIEFLKVDVYDPTPNPNWDGNTGTGKRFSNIQCVDAADILILIVTPSFLSSRDLVQSELPAIIRRSSLTRAPIIPVIAKEANWNINNFGKSLRAPNYRNAVRLFSWGMQQKGLDKALAEIAGEIRKHFGRRVATSF